MKHLTQELRKPLGWIPPFMTNSTCWSYLDGNVKRDTNPDSSDEIIHNDRDSMRAAKAVDTDAEGFGGDPIEDNIDTERAKCHRSDKCWCGKGYYYKSKCTFWW